MYLYKAKIKFLNPIKTPVHPSGAIIASDTFVSGIMCNAALVGQAELLKESLFSRQVEFSSIFSSKKIQTFAVRNAVNRITSEAVPFPSYYWYAQEGEFWFRCTKEKNILALINLLGDSGIGGQRNLGKGRFVVDDCQQVSETNNRQQLVSLCVPADDDKIDKKQAQWVRRSGYTEESWHGQPNRYKDHIWAIKEKTPLDSTVKGKITMLDDTIFHYGYAMFVPEETSKSY
jgi:CRISPR type III-A-associated RAMP protein Csm4